MAHEHWIEQPSDLRDVVVLGLPESLPGRIGARRIGPLIPITTCYTRYWQWIKSDSSAPGDPIGVWNLIGRLQSEEEGQYMIDRLTSGRPFSYGARLQISDITSAVASTESAGPMTTNCVGFVCTAYASIGLHLLPEAFGFSYRSAYEDQAPCDHPRPGHLARAFSDSIARPYVPSNQSEAERYCLVRSTLQELQAQESDPWTRSSSLTQGSGIGG